MKRTTTIFLLVALALSSYADMISVPGGTFTMGIYQGYGGHTVTVSTFWMDAAHITVGEYQVYCAATTNEMPDAPLWGWDNTNLPMCNVTWQEASDYAEWAGKRLPTEAEYEYAMRSGYADKVYPWGDTITSTNANYSRNVGQPTVAGSYPTNAYGLHDIAGNMWNWCGDWYQYSLSDPVTNPTGPATGEFKCIRGGSYSDWSSRLCCYYRAWGAPGSRYANLGFRCVSSTWEHAWERVDTGVSAYSGSITYSYDDDNRLVEARYSSLGFHMSEYYTHDNADNVIQDISIGDTRVEQSFLLWLSRLKDNTGRFFRALAFWRRGEPDDRT